ncbi:MAG: hypothetical protein R6X02_00435 [Enhygromyxa sp.]
MRTKVAIASGFSLCLAVAACKDEPPVHTGPEPMRAPPGGAPPMLPDRPAAADDDETGDAGEPKDADERPPVVLPERPRADPDIDRALDLIGASGLRFLDPRSDPEQRPSEYTAEQFAGMLRTKWDWLGYDLTALEPWLEEIATRSFKTNLPYLVVLTDGTTRELRPWLDEQLRAGPTGDE